MKPRLASHILTGHMVNAGCFARTDDGVKSTFEKVVTSLKAL